MNSIELNISRVRANRGAALRWRLPRCAIWRSAAVAKEIKTLIGNVVEQVDAGAKLVSQAGSTMDEVVSARGKVGFRCTIRARQLA